MRVLAISAHPDDAELGAGGIIQRADVRRIVVLSRGEAGGDPQQRTREQMESAGILRATCSMHNLTDTEFDLKRTIEILEAEVREFKPDMVVTMAARDTHQDHRTTYRASMVACRDVPCTILTYVGPSSAPGFQPTWFVPLSESEMRVKLAALACHHSQSGREYMVPAAVESMARYWAMVERCGAQYVEPFECIRYLDKVAP